LIYLRERRAKQKGKDGFDENYLKNFELLDDPLENNGKKHKLSFSNSKKKILKNKAGLLGVTSAKNS